MLEIIQKLEPVFWKAGNLACEMQTGVSTIHKDSSGIAEMDIVTKADYAVQELILEAMVKTDLTNCRLLAEEDTPLTSKFNPGGKLFITLDPINGTSLYAKGKTFFNLIVGLHDGVKPLYSFFLTPKIQWAVKIVGNEITQIGSVPTVAIQQHSSKVIAYSYGNPQEYIPEEYEELADQGYVFKFKKELTNEAGTTLLYLSGSVAGSYCENPIVNDGLISWHYALSRGDRVITGGPNGHLDISAIVDSPQGPYHPGYYLIVSKD